jgi:hypothetical protein
MAKGASERVVRIKTFLMGICSVVIPRAVGREDNTQVFRGRVLWQFVGSKVPGIRWARVRWFRFNNVRSAGGVKNDNVALGGVGYPVPEEAMSIDAVYDSLEATWRAREGSEIVGVRLSYKPVGAVIEDDAIRRVVAL